MSALRVRVVVPLVAALSLLASACASPPEAEKKAADEAVSAASAAGAEKYAPSEFSAMAAGVKKAESEMSSKAYKEAKASYESVKDLAGRAAKAAEAGKAAAKTAVEKQLAEIEGRWKDLEAKAEASSKGLNADQKTVWDIDAKGVAEAFEVAKSSLATDTGAAEAKLASIRTVLDKWEGDLAALAAVKPDDKERAAKK